VKLAFVFPGQGSQSVGMMQGWGDYAEVRATFAEASDASARPVGAGHCCPADLLNQTSTPGPRWRRISAWRVWRAAGGATPAAGWP
jgi:[acyl-carrier-protein] S-malonyltransferase